MRRRYPLLLIIAVLTGSPNCGHPATAVDRAATTVSVRAAVVASGITGVSPTAIPLRTGLTIVTAVNVSSGGDVEAIHRVTQVTDDSVSLVVTGEIVNEAVENGPATRPVHITRTVRREDLQHAREYMQMFDEDAPEIFPATTAVSVSTDVLEDLKTNGASALTVGVGRVHLPDRANSILEVLPDFAAELNSVTKVSGTLTRVEREAVPFRVLLNDTPTDLPAVHARGALSGAVGSDNSEFWILDDSRHPLVLRWSLERFGREQVIRISYPAEPRGSADRGESNLARQLTESRRAAVYGIHFDFGSDRITEDSLPVLDEIARVLANNPGWAMSVEGHTDGIGESELNLDLSKRRAAAVKDTLTTRYRIDATRLTTIGSGESRPLDTNETLEGRARNRRVELVRQP